MFLRSRDIISSSIYGGVLVALVQGALGGVAFWLLGLPAPILWGFVMFLFSILPVVGSPLIWIPAVVYLFISGAYIKALLLLVWGALIIGSVDNILKPIIISGKTAMHPLLLLFSILGAIKVFGFIGVIAGPLILSLALSIIEIYRENLKKRKRRETRP
jgi:predicted PurR-regulated permease PerM